MAQSMESERHYRVVRFYPQAGKGLLEEVLAENLSFDEAEALASQEAPVVHDEVVVVVDQDKVGLDAEIEEFIAD